MQKINILLDGKIFQFFVLFIYTNSSLISIHNIYYFLTSFMVLIISKFKTKVVQKVKKRSWFGKNNSIPGKYSIKWKYKISANCFESSNWQFRNFFFLNSEVNGFIIEKVKDQKLIRQNYLKSKQFKYDCLALLPIDYIYYAVRSRLVSFKD